MESKIMQVFYGNDCLPYKDRERQVHYPIVGNAFLGASNTTKIRFYFDYIGDSNTTWVSVAKLPNGKQGSRVLPIASDDDGNYAELELSNWYTQAKGDVYIALQGYQGGVQYEYDSETELYEIHGTPTIQTTGSIKLAINYAPIGQAADYNDEFSTYQDILAALGSKLDITSGIIVVSDISQLVATNYENGQIFYNVADKKFYQLNSGDFVVFQTYITLTTSPISQDDYDLILNHPEYPIIYSGYLYWKLRDTGTILEYSALDLTNFAGNGFTVSKDLIRIQKSTRLFEHIGINGNGYSQLYIDTQLATKQNQLVSGTNIKTINGQSILGSGDLPISGGGSAEWGAISGDIQEQTDLQNEFQDIRAEIAGRAQNISISYAQTAPINDADARLFKKFDNTAFTDLADFNSYVSGLTLANNTFYSTSGFVSIDQSKYIIDLGKKVIKASDIRDYYNVGNSNLFIAEQTYSNGDPLPDRWYAQLAVVDSSNFILIFNALESKVDVSGLATTGDLAIAQYEIEREIAPEYSPLTIYAVGDKVIYNHKLYTCTTAIETPETWDSTKWSQISVASGFVDLDKAQVISGEKTFSPAIYLQRNSLEKKFVSSAPTTGDLIVGGGNSIYYYLRATNFTPYANNYNDLGTSTNKWKDLYLSGTFYNTGYQLSYNNAYEQLRISNGSGTLKYAIGVGTTYNSVYSLTGADLGTSSYKWKDLYLSGVLSDGTNSATVADISNGIFNVINASDIASYTLTQAQYDLITNGKPTLISGVYNNFTNLRIENTFDDGTYIRLKISYFTQYGENKVVSGYITKSNRTLNIGGGGFIINNTGRLDAPNLGYVNGKQIPTYPSNTGTFVLKCVDGVLTWVAE